MFVTLSRRQKCREMLTATTIEWATTTIPSPAIFSA